MLTTLLLFIACTIGQPEYVQISGKVTLADGTPVEGVAIRAWSLDEWNACTWHSCPWNFVGCMSGPTSAHPACLIPFDADGDGDVDLRDLAAMTR